MFKLTLRLFLLLTVTGSVSNLKCLRTDTSSCDFDVDMHTILLCMQSYSEYCDSPNVCLMAKFESKISPTISRTLSNCGSKNNCDEDVIKPILGKELGDRWKAESKSVTCKFCDNEDNCYPLDYHRKELKGPKNFTAAPAPKKKSGTSRSHNQITMQQISIFVLLSLFSYF